MNELMGEDKVRPCTCAPELVFVHRLVSIIFVIGSSVFVNKTICEDGSSCYYLCEADTSYLTLYHILDVCSKERLEMTRIESSQTQTVKEKLLQDLPQSTRRQIWIAGQRRTDDQCTHRNGTEFSNQLLVHLPFLWL